MPRAGKQTLWAGPEDGKEVVVEDGQLQYFVNLPSSPPPTMISAGDVLEAGTGGKPVGRYQYNASTARFEWMGWE